MKILCSLLLCLLWSDAAFGQIRFDKAIAVSQSDPIYPVLKARQLEIQKQYEAGGYAIATFSKWVLVDSPALAKLFPKLRFASIAYMESVNPKVKPLPAHDLASFKLTVAVDLRSLNILNEEMDTGDEKQFGELLRNSKIQIRSVDEARAVWNAFCAITHYHWENEPIVKVSDTVWHLGDTSDGKFHYFFEVLLDSDHLVESGKLEAVGIK